MKRVSFADIKKSRRWIVPAGIVLLGGAAAAGHAGLVSSRANVSTVHPASPELQFHQTPAPTVSPDITINGQKVPVNHGSRDIPIPGGTAHIEASGGHTSVTAHSEQSGDTSNSQSSNIDINIDSNSSNGRSSTTLHNHNSSTNVSGSSSTSTFSSGESNVDVWQ